MSEESEREEERVIPLVDGPYGTGNAALVADPKYAEVVTHSSYLRTAKGFSEASYGDELQPVFATIPTEALRVLLDFGAEFKQSGPTDAFLEKWYAVPGPESCSGDMRALDRRMTAVPINSDLEDTSNPVNTIALPWCVARVAVAVWDEYDKDFFDVTSLWSWGDCLFHLDVLAILLRSGSDPTDFGDRCTTTVERLLAANKTPPFPADFGVYKTAGAPNTGCLAASEAWPSVMASLARSGLPYVEYARFLDAAAAMADKHDWPTDAQLPPFREEDLRAVLFTDTDHWSHEEDCFFYQQHISTLCPPQSEVYSHHTEMLVSLGASLEERVGRIKALRGHPLIGAHLGPECAVAGGSLFRQLCDDEMAPPSMYADPDEPPRRIARKPDERPSDIDVFCTPGAALRLAMDAHKRGWKVVDGNTVDEKDDSNYNAFSRLVVSRSGFRDIDIIVISPDATPASWVAGFDIGCVQLAFDGTTVRAGHAFWMWMCTAHALYYRFGRAGGMVNTNQRPKKNLRDRIERYGAHALIHVPKTTDNRAHDDDDGRSYKHRMSGGPSTSTAVSPPSVAEFVLGIMNHEQLTPLVCSLAGRIGLVRCRNPRIHADLVAEVTTCIKNYNNKVFMDNEHVENRTQYRRSIWDIAPREYVVAKRRKKNDD